MGPLSSTTATSTTITTPVQRDLTQLRDSSDTLQNTRAANLNAATGKTSIESPKAQIFAEQLVQDPIISQGNRRGSLLDLSV